MKIGFILGSGWGKITTHIKNPKKTPYKTIFETTTTVPGHTGEVISGKLAGKDVIFLSGRFHTYEGYTSKEAARTVEYLHDQKVTHIVITSASGGLNPLYRVGDLVILQDIITLFCPSPLTGPHFQDMSQPFSVEMRQLAEKIAADENIRIQKGVYVYTRGPHFETFSDKMALRFLGADVVGMSTVPEVIMASHFGMEVLGLSLVTNLAFVKHAHKDVLAAAQAQEKQLALFFEQFITYL